MSVVSGDIHNQARRLPLVYGGETARPMFLEHGQTIDSQQFLADVARLQHELPGNVPVANLCQRRYEFAVVFAAVAANGQCNLLPPSRAPGAVTEVLARHPGAIAVMGRRDPAIDIDCQRLAVHREGRTGVVPQIPTDQCVAIGHTSGSTGRCSAHRKLWGQFQASNACNLAAIKQVVGGPFQMLATVPSQHMYGIEMTLLLPLGGPVALVGGMPFYPADMIAALKAMAAPRVLVTTPLHLRALLDAELTIPPLAAIVSATAALPVALARRAEARSGATLLEAFGSTETCVIATRQTAREDAWRLYHGVELQAQPDGTRVRAPWLPHEVLLADIVEQADPRHFRLHGRQADLLEIAGKRASLADLSQRLKAIAGVRDAVVFQGEHSDARGARRLLALVVAPATDEATILAQLRRQIDPVFLPRPLYRVPRLPRNDVGKLPRTALLALLKQLES